MPPFPTLQPPGSGDTDPLISDQQPLRSSPISISSPRRRSPNAHNVASGTPHSRHSEHQWSLFGQLMENEGHLGVTPASITSTSSTGDYFARGSNHRSESTHSNLRAFAQLSPNGSHEASPGRVDLALHEVPVEAIEYDSDDSSSSTYTFRRTQTTSRNAWLSWTLQLWRPATSLVWRNVFKCAIAYFVASLFTFSPYLSRWIAPVTSDSSTIPSPSGHMVATM
jgi:hypothetical protein